MTRYLLVAAVLVSGAALAQENEKGVLVISPVAGGVQSSRGAGGSYGLSVGYLREEGRFSYGVTALGTGGTWSWAGASLDGRWALLDGPFSPYLGLGLGAFESRRAGLDLGIRPTATAEAGFAFRHLFAGVRALLPLSSRTDGPRPHDDAGLSDVALLAQVGFRL